MVVGSVVGNAPVSQLKGVFGCFDGRVSIAAVARGTPVWEWASGVEWDGQFIIAAVTHKVFERTGSIVVARGTQFALQNRVGSLKIVSVAAHVDVDLVLCKDFFDTV